MTLTVSSFEEVNSFAQNIEGWLSENDAKLIYSTVSALSGSGCIVEIGSWCGKSLLYEAFAAINNKFSNKIYSIDPFLTSKDEPNGRYDIFIENLKKFGIFDKITQIKEKSQIAGLTFEDKIEFIFIDGFHKYDFVKKDFELFYPKVVLNGYMAFHDVCASQGPTDLILELAEKNLIKIVDLSDLTLLIQKTANITESDIENNNKFVDIIRARIKNVELIK